MLTPKQAEKELKLAVQLNPGSWQGHSFSVAKNARLIAEKAKEMDQDKAYVMGLLHDKKN